MKKLIYIFYSVILIYFLLTLNGCSNPDLEPPKTGKCFVNLSVDPESVPLEGGSFTVSVNEDWCGPSTTNIAVWIWMGDPVDSCFAYAYTFQNVSKNSPQVVSLNTSSFSPCNSSGQTYKIVVQGQTGTPDSDCDPGCHDTTARVSLTWGTVAGGQLIVDKAREMLSGFPHFFEPSTQFNDWVDTNKNRTGCVSWSPTAHNLRTSYFDGANETKVHYRHKLDSATILNQINWHQYLCGYYYNDFSKGFAFPLSDDSTFESFGPESFVTCSSGFVCYAFVWAAAVEAGGYVLPFDFTGGSAGDPFQKLLEYEHPVNRQVGDIVIYRTYAQSYYDHVAIIKQVNPSDMKYDRVISAYGFHEAFLWGAKETNLWDFHSTRANPPGIFTSELDGGKWPDLRDHWTLNDVTIVRLR